MNFRSEKIDISTKTHNFNVLNMNSMGIPYLIMMVRDSRIFCSLLYDEPRCNYIKCLVSYNGRYEFVNVNSLSFVNINRSNNKPVRYKISYHVMSS